MMAGMAVGRPDKGAADSVQVESLRLVFLRPSAGTAPDGVLPLADNRPESICNSNAYPSYTNVGGARVGAIPCRRLGALPSQNLTLPYVRRVV